MKLVVLGLSLSSSWGNGHATTFRSLLSAFADRGHEVLFLEREQPWYAANRDLANPGYCRLDYYDAVPELERWRGEIANADAVIVGSYVPDGIEVGRWVQRQAGGTACFYDIDTPVTLAALDRGECDYLSPALIPGYDIYFSFTGGPTLTRLEEEFGSPRARALHCTADTDEYRPMDVPKRWDLSYLGTYSDDRQPILERLLMEPARACPDRRFAVAGPQYPDHIEWPDNVERIDHVPPAGHAGFYAASRFTLNATRADMIAAGWSPSVRLFEAAACGAPIISDEWRGIEDYFRPDEEIILARSSEQVVAALDRPAGPIGEAARRTVLEHHSARRRAQELESELETAGRTLRREAVRSVGSMTNGNGNGRGVTLVAGGAGFIGSHLCRWLLERGEQVVCLDNLQTSRETNLLALESYDGFSFVEADIGHPLPSEVTRQTTSFTRIYNLACAASPRLYQADPEHTMLTNVVGTDRLLRLAEQTGARFLLTSTSEVYGDPEIHPQPEHYRGNVSCTGPRACYDEGKRAAETLTFDFARSGRADVRVARIFNTYGPQMRADDGRVISNMICQALSGEPLTIYGDGSQTRSFCYVDDTVDGLVRLMESDLTDLQPVNIGNPAEITIRELVEALTELFDHPLDLVTKPLPVDDPQRRRPDISRARQVLGWQPKTSLRAGLSRTVAWFADELKTNSTAAGPEALLGEPRVPVPAVAR